ncbi:hypothetical protein GOV04_00100 [Candidatus Woesearchaeota archaeon]|nr:hypothetical protein [Candidatus Woesearchaeota archaeon]
MKKAQMTLILLIFLTLIFIFTMIALTNTELQEQKVNAQVINNCKALNDNCTESAECCSSFCQGICKTQPKVTIS